MLTFPCRTCGWVGTFLPALHEHHLLAHERPLPGVVLPPLTPLEAGEAEVLPYARNGQIFTTPQPFGGDAHGASSV